MWINIEKLQGFILKDKEILQTWHLVRFRLPGTPSFTEKIFWIKDISDFNGKLYVKKDSEKWKRYQRSLCLVKIWNDRLDQITSQGFSVSYDPPGHGNHQFSALSNSLLNLGFYRSPQSLQCDDVNSLREKYFLNGMLLEVLQLIL